MLALKYLVLYLCAHSRFAWKREEQDGMRLYRETQRRRRRQGRGEEEEEKEKEVISDGRSRFDRYAGQLSLIKALTKSPPRPAFGRAVRATNRSREFVAVFAGNLR